MLIPAPGIFACSFRSVISLTGPVNAHPRGELRMLFSALLISMAHKTGASGFVRKTLSNSRIASEFISNFGKEYDHRVRLRPIGIVRNRLCCLPLENVVRGVEGCVNPAAPWVLACFIH